MTDLNGRKIGLLEIVTPLVITIFCGLCYNLYAQQNKLIDSKADKEKVATLCREVEHKVDNSTLQLMIKALEVQDKNHDSRLKRQEDIQNKQLDLLHGIQKEIRIMNDRLQHVEEKTE